MSASLPAEELPRRIARAVADELRGRQEMDAADTLAEMRRLRSVVALRSRRPSSVIEAQLAAFLATLPAGVTAPPPGDFAAQLQWDAWQNHRQELEAELDQAIEAELDDELPMPLTGLVNIPISNLDNFWPETPATASGQTDGKPNRYK